MSSETKDNAGDSKEEPAQGRSPVSPTATGTPVGKVNQDGGTLQDETGRVVGYTREGAVSAVEGGPVDPTIRPSWTPEGAPEPGAVLERGEAPGEAPKPAPRTSTSSSTSSRGTTKR